MNKNYSFVFIKSVCWHYIISCCDDYIAACEAASTVRRHFRRICNQNQNLCNMGISLVELRILATKNKYTKRKTSTIYTRHDIKVVTQTDIYDQMFLTPQIHLYIDSLHKICRMYGMSFIVALHPIIRNLLCSLLLDVLLRLICSRYSYGNLSQYIRHIWALFFMAVF